MSASPFCPHKRLRTSCPACKATAIPPPAEDATPFVPAEERERKEARRGAREAAREAGEAELRERKATQRPTGPGKPLMPVRERKRGVSANEAAAAKPWWVRK